MINKLNNKIWNYSIFIIRIILGATFLFSGISKAFDVGNFRWALIELKIFGWTLASFISIVVIIAEIILGLLIIIGLFKKFATIHLGIMIIAFGWISVFAMIYSDFENCNCLGKWINLSYGPGHLALLAVLFILNVLVFIDRSGFLSLDSYFRKKFTKKYKV
jgi:uncharacterized membrane protein YphA (DoxX/SURF4 family)